MQIVCSAIPEVLILEPDVFDDERGFFFESYNRARFEKLGIAETFVQDSASFSRRATLRGLHYQKGRHAQSKLVRAVTGRILDVALDIRAGSPTFGRCAVCELSGENHRQLYIPKGFAHGFVVLSETAHVLYKTDALYAPQSEGAVNALDADLALDWTIESQALILSEKDRRAPGWLEYCRSPDFVYEDRQKCC